MKRISLFLICFLLVTTNLFAQQAQRIISLVPSITKELYLLGQQHRIVGRTSYCEIAENDRIPVVASSISLNLEQAVSLKPDLIIASSLISPETIESLKKLGIRTELFSYPKSFSEICSQFIRLGELTGARETANQIVVQAETRLQELQKKVPQNARPKMFLQIGAKPLFCAVPDTFMDDFIRLAGGVNIASDLKSGSITREAVLTRNPDVIFIVTMGITAVEEKQTWEKYKALNATRNQQIFILDADKTCSPTPLHFTEALEEMIDLAYGLKSRN